MRKILLALAVFTLGLSSPGWAYHAHQKKISYYKPYHNAYHSCGYWCKAKKSHYYRHHYPKKVCTTHSRKWENKAVYHHRHNDHSYEKHSRTHDDSYGHISIGHKGEDGYFKISIGRKY